MKNGLLPLSDEVAAAALPAAREYNLRDTKLPGLALRVLPTGGKSWVMRVRVDGRARRVTLGDAWRMPVEDARSKAHALMAGDHPEPLPAKSKAMTFEVFAALYRERRAPSWKPSTLYTYDCYLRSTLMPFFAAMPLDGIVTADVARWYHAYGATWSGGANRALAILRDMFNRAKIWGLIANGTLNPCREDHPSPQRAQGPAPEPGANAAPRRGARPLCADPAGSGRHHSLDSANRLPVRRDLQAALDGSQ